MLRQQLLRILALPDRQAALIEGVDREAGQLSVQQLDVLNHPLDFEVILVGKAGFRPLEDVLFDRGRGHRHHACVALKRGA